jgi:DNA-3-methyladenine glycosylase
MKIDKKFFELKADIVARELLGKNLIREIGGRILRAKIVETEAYFGEEDPASRASKGKNKISEMMWESPGKILIYNVHKYKMLNFITDKKGIPSAVLIRAVEPLNFDSKCSGPGLLTNSLKIDNKFHGENIFDLKNLELKNSEDKFEIVEKFRIGVTKDLDIPLRFYIKGNEFVSKK